MANKVKKKFYAIKEGRGVHNKIVNTWKECRELVLGYNAVYKSFKTLDEAQAYLGDVDVVKVKEQSIKGIESRKKKKATTRSINFRISKELYEDFEKKCKEMELAKEKVIENMIMEWVI